MNAFTTHEQTVFYVRVPDTQLERAFDILADVLWQPGVPSRRRRVGTAGHPRRDRDARRHARRSRARPVRARASSPSTRSAARCSAARRRSPAMPRDRIAEYHARALPAGERRVRGGRQPRRTTRVLELRRRAQFPDRCRRAPAAAARRAGRAASRVVGRCTATPSRRTSCSACGRSPALDPDRYALDRREPGARRRHVVAPVPGDPRDSAASRTPCSRTEPRFDDTGFLAIYAGTAPERVHETLDVIDDRARPARRATACPTPSSTAAKGHLTGSLAMSLETSASRMRRLGRSELVEGEIPTLDEVIARIEAVTADDVAPRRSTACSPTRRARSRSSARTTTDREFCG